MEQMKEATPHGQLIVERLEQHMAELEAYKCEHNGIIKVIVDLIQNQHGVWQIEYLLVQKYDRTWHQYDSSNLSYMSHDGDCVQEFFWRKRLSEYFWLPTYDAVRIGDCLCYEETRTSECGNF
ncbi:MAG: hypothetical protein KAJ63_03370 [Methyloprofundus sp.]|nr:hypothetical protein [Methyloprofundus sp.]